jgi:hypothetical protein
MTTEPKTIDVELTHDEFVCLLAGARPDSRLMTRLKAASRLPRHKTFGSIYFWFTGTEAETHDLLALATARAPGAVPRIRQGLRLARDKARA